MDIPMELRTLLNECGNLEKDHCSIARLAEGIERHIQKRPIGPPVQTRVISMAADLRINEYGRAVGILRFNSDADVESVEWEIASGVAATRLLPTMIETSVSGRCLSVRKSRTDKCASESSK